MMIVVSCSSKDNSNEMIIINTFTPSAMFLFDKKNDIYILTSPYFDICTI